MLPPMPALMYGEELVIRLADRPSGTAGDRPARYADPGVAIRANVARPAETVVDVASRRATVLRARFTTPTNPTATDPNGATRLLAHGDGIDYRGRRWTAVGPLVMEGEMDGAVTSWSGVMDRVS